MYCIHIFSLVELLKMKMKKTNSDLSSPESKLWTTVARCETCNEYFVNKIFCIQVDWVHVHDSYKVNYNDVLGLLYDSQVNGNSA